MCVIKFYESIKEIEKASDIGIRRGQKSTALLISYSGGFNSGRSLSHTGILNVL